MTFPTRAASQGVGSIEGTVTIATTSQPLSDVRITIVGTTRGARTDGAGKYRLPGLAPGAYEIRAQRIGYAAVTRAVTVTANQLTPLNVEMKEAALSLDALVVTGTASESRQKEVGTALATIDTKLLEVQPVTNTQDILSARSAGITVLGNSGQPGAGGTIRLRGTNSITQGNNPVVYVDGVRIYSSGGPITPSARQSALALNDIKAEDIDRIEVVKGAAATTLYGTEASGGVIQIFTKRGSAGPPQWNLEVGEGANFMGHIGTSADPTGMFVNQCRGDNLHDAFGAKFVDATCPSSGTWLKKGAVGRYGLAARGGGDVMSYFLSGNFNSENGVVGPGAQRDGGFRGNFSFNPARNLFIAVNTSYNRKFIQFVPDGNLANGFLLNVARGPANNFKGGKGECVGITITCTANAYVFDQKITNDADHFISGFAIQWSPIAALTNRFNIGYDFNNSDNKAIIPFAFLGSTPLGSINNSNWYHTKVSLDYAGSFHNALRVQSLASTLSWGGQIFNDVERFTGVTGSDFSGPGDPTLASAARVTLGRDDRPRVVNAGFFLAEMVGWNDRLFVTGGLRVDGNSAFGSAFGLQKYPKISAAYVISEEAFWPRTWLPVTKLRAAMGESGKAPGAFDAVRTWDPVAGDDGKPGVSAAQVGNPNLGPERTRELELGVDASGLDDRASLELTLFRSRTYGALIGVTLPPSQGFSRSQLENVGTIQNEGLESQLGLTMLRRSGFEWTSRVNATWLRSKTLDIGGQVIATGNGSSVRDAYVGATGQTPQHMPVPALYGAKILNPDSIGNPIIGTDQYYGPVYPPRIIGAGTTLTLRRNLSLDIQAEYQGGAFLPNFIGYQNALRNVWYPCYAVQQALKAAQGPDGKTGTPDDVLSALAGIKAIDRGRCAIDAAARNSDYWNEKTDFVKLRSVSLSYVLPPRFLRGAKSATLVVSGRNLWRWTKFTGADPESYDASDAGTNLGRREYYQVPPYKTMLVTVRTTF